MLRLVLVIVVPFGAVFALHAYVRGIDAVLGEILQTDLGISAADIGVVTSAYLLTYALMQIPAGIMLDAWGYRRTLALLLVVASCGALIFSQGEGTATLTLGRAVLGLGMAVSLSAAVKALADCVSADQMPTYNGFVIALGGVGALLATAPSVALFSVVDWRAVFVSLSATLLILAVVVLRVGRAMTGDTQTSQAGWSDAFAGLREVLSSPYFWRATGLISVSYGGFAAVQGLWLAPWLKVVGGVAADRVDMVLLVVAASMTVGTLSFGLVRAVGRASGLGLPAMVAIGASLHLITQGLVIAQVFTASLLFWVAFGLLAPITMLIYILLAEHFGPERSGRAISAANVFICLTAVAVQNVAGLMVSLWPRATEDASFLVYRGAASLFVLLGAVMLLLFLPLCRKRIHANTDLQTTP